MAPEAINLLRSFYEQGNPNGTKVWTRCSINHEHHLDGNGEHFWHEMKKDDDPCFLNYSSNCSQLSSSSTMPNNSTPIFVYQRKRQQKDSVVTMQPCAVTKSSDACLPASCSEVPSLAPQEHVISGEEAGSAEALTTELDRSLNIVNAIENCSSSKSNLGLSSGALKIDRDNGGECSSSGALFSDKVQEDISERDICISLLRSQGLLDGLLIRQAGASTKQNGVKSDKYCSKSCKVCAHRECTKNLLICDSCEDAFHIACYNPRIAIVPVGDWLCSSCLKKKHKILIDKSTGNAVNSSTETGRIGCLESELNLGSLEFMFRDTEPYMSNVRIGDDFQADVPNWRGPVNEESDLSGEPVEIAHSNNINKQEQDPIKLLKLGAIGNWLQCREVRAGIGEGVDGTVCGKWRRAPLFEVQTDNWECFRCILWDPAHADCAVPQELETEEVMKQLKYIEMLRPRLAAKRRRMDSSRSNGSQERV